MNLVDLVAILALLQFFAFGQFVGHARGKYGVKAPAITGNEMFERAFRVQMNTLELLVLFIPALYLGAKYWFPSYVAATGVVYIVGRIIYWRAYMAAPQTRTLGFVLSIGPCLVLLVASLIGVVRSVA